MWGENKKMVEVRNKNDLEKGEEIGRSKVGSEKKKRGERINEC